MPTYIERHQGFSGPVFIRGNLGPHCAQCRGVGEYLCDWPISNGQTCNKPMCERHTYEAGPSTHYCEMHRQDYERSLDGGAA